jgi:excinuclease ABC subunit A
MVTLLAKIMLDKDNTIEVQGARVHLKNIDVSIPH